MSDSNQTEIHAQQQAFDHIIEKLLVQISADRIPSLKHAFNEVGNLFTRLYTHLAKIQTNPSAKEVFMQSNGLDLRSFQFLKVVNNIWQVSRVESRGPTLVAVADWILKLNDEAFSEFSCFDHVYNNDDIIESSDFKSTSVPTLPESSPASCETQITVSITVPTNYANDIIDDLQQLSLQPNFQKISDFSIVSHTKHSINDSPELSCVDSDGFHEDNNVSTIFDDLDREFGLSGFIEKIDALFASCVENPDPDLCEFVSSPVSRRFLPPVVTPDKLLHDDQCPANASSNHDYGILATFASVACFKIYPSLAYHHHPPTSAITVKLTSYIL